MEGRSWQKPEIIINDQKKKNKNMLVCPNGKCTGFLTSWHKKRKTLVSTYYDSKKIIFLPKDIIMKYK